MSASNKAEYDKKFLRQWRKRNPEKVKAQQKRQDKKRRIRTDYYSYRKWKNIKRLYGIGREEYLSLLISQENRCPICGQMLEFSDSQSSVGSQGIAVDHDHATKRVRGLVHNLCNRGIGMLKDDPIICRRAADYLEGKI